MTWESRPKAAPQATHRGVTSSLQGSPGVRALLRRVAELDAAVTALEARLARWTP
jgi:hypothetical protein